MAAVVKSTAKLQGMGTRGLTLHGAGGNGDLNPHTMDLESQLRRK